MLTARTLLPLVLMLNACVPGSQPAIAPEVATRAVNIHSSTLPPMKQFAPRAAPLPHHANQDLAADFLDLTFTMESGRQLPVFTRFEGPITIAVTGDAPPTLAADLNRLLARLREEAGIDIRLTRKSGANITIQAVPHAKIRKLLPQAACFVAPNVSTLAQYRRARRTSKTDWTTLKTREKLAIFLPSDAAPQEIRDCLHEEVAQALGPLNDLYRLPTSVFNDDNVHTVLTGFDMLILRATYDPALRSGMGHDAVARALPGILARINPAGAALPQRAAARTPPLWARSIQTALGRGIGLQTRQRAATRALNIAVAQGWQDHRRAFAHYAMGRVLQLHDAQAAEHHYRRADSFYARRPETQLHRAYVATQRAAHAVSRGDGAGALRLLAPHLAAAQASENAALLATLQLLRAEALELEGRATEARGVRLDSIGWARYGFGPDWAVRAKLREVAALNPLKGS